MLKIFRALRSRTHFQVKVKNFRSHFARAQRWFFRNFQASARNFEEVSQEFSSKCSIFFALASLAKNGRFSIIFIQMAKFFFTLSSLAHSEDFRNFLTNAENFRARFARTQRKFVTNFQGKDQNFSRSLRLRTTGFLRNFQNAQNFALA